MNVLRAQILILAIVIGLTSCNYDSLHDVGALDVELRERIEKASPTGEMDHFVLPSGLDFDKMYVSSLLC